MISSGNHFDLMDRCLIDRCGGQADIPVSDRSLICVPSMMKKCNTHSLIKVTDENAEEISTGSRKCKIRGKFFFSTGID